MSEVAKQQAHNKFKVFAGDLAPDKTIGPLAGDVASFVKTAKVAPKSIGVEYLESAKRLVVTLGYRDDEPPYSVRLDCIPLGKIDGLSGDFSALEKAMAAAGNRYPNIICHELYVTAERDFIMVVMRHQE